MTVDYWKVDLPEDAVAQETGLAAPRDRHTVFRWLKLMTAGF